LSTIEHSRFKAKIGFERYEIFHFPSQDVQQKAGLANQSVWLGLPLLFSRAGVDQQS
jgi:hypothetical protein